ncbi:MAG: trypsin-like peptidase domain-containing protein [Candidatus Saccharimonadales bacterium]
MEEQKDVTPIAKKKRFKLLKINSRKLLRVLAVILLIATSSGVSSYLTAYMIKSGIKTTTNTTQVYNVSDDSNVVGIVNQISKSVVNITTKTVVYGWFGQRSVSEGAGTGIIIRDDGYILTNNHVIDGADSISIITNDDEELTATVIAADASKDLAVIKVKSDVTLTAAKIGDSDKVRVGEEVIAVGNVLGQFSYSVTKGIVSGLGRPIVASGSALYGNLEQLSDLIQTDAAINSGNSGGPLVNMSGEVIGINTAVSGSGQNIGFSVPINHAKNLVKDIK